MLAMVKLVAWVQGTAAGKRRDANTEYATGATQETHK